MSLRAEVQILVDRVLRHNEAITNGIVPINSDLVVDVLLLENEILAFRAAVMDEGSMQTLKSDLQQVVDKYRIP